MTSGASLVRSYASLVGSSKGLVESSSQLLQQAQEGARSAAGTLSGIEEASSSITGAVSESSSALAVALGQAAAGFEAVSQSIDTAFDSAGALASDSSSQLRAHASDVRGQASSISSIIDDLTKIMDSAQSEIAKSALKLAIAQLQTSMESLERLASSLESSADQIDAGTADVAGKRQEAKDLAAQAKASIEAARDEYDNVLKPQLDDLMKNVEKMGGALSSSVSTLDSATSELIDSSSSVSCKLGAMQSKLDAAASSLDSAASRIADFSGKIQDALASKDVALLQSILGSDITSLATSLSAPVGLDRHALFEVSNFGSGMSPLYTSLALWIGALLIMVALKVTPSQKTLEELDNPKLPQVFIGRFGVVALISLSQSTVMGLGNMMFLGVQVAEPLLYMLCLWCAGLVFAFIIYTLVASFANLGKALGVIVLILQVTGSGGSYPLQLFPSFFQSVSPFLPATYAVNAIREAMFGMYAGDFWANLGGLLLFLVPFAIIGLILRNPFMKLVDFFVQRVEDSKIV